MQVLPEAFSGLAESRESGVGLHSLAGVLPQSQILVFKKALPKMGVSFLTRLPGAIEQII